MSTCGCPSESRSRLPATLFGLGQMLRRPTPSSFWDRRALGAINTHNARTNLRQILKTMQLPPNSPLLVKDIFLISKIESKFKMWTRPTHSDFKHRLLSEKWFCPFCWHLELENKWAAITVPIRWLFHPLTFPGLEKGCVPPHSCAGLTRPDTGDQLSISVSTARKSIPCPRARHPQAVAIQTRGSSLDTVVCKDSPNRLEATSITTSRGTLAGPAGPRVVICPPSPLCS